MDYDTVRSVAEEVKKYPIYYVDTPGSIDEIYNTIKAFRELPNVKNKWLVIMLDHVLLTKGSATDRERETIYNLQKMFIEVKKLGKTSIIQVSQMNRDIEDKDRILNSALHFPLRKDLFGSDSIFQSSDYVIVLHRPEILGLTVYGIKNWPVKDMLYAHFLKCREGEPKILSFKNDLKYNNIEEYNPFTDTPNLFNSKK
jgi:replicative DNA helicase